MAPKASGLTLTVLAVLLAGVMWLSAVPGTGTPQQRAWNLLAAASAPSGASTVGWEAWAVPSDVFVAQATPHWPGVPPAHLSAYPHRLQAAPCQGSDFEVAHLNRFEYDYIAHTAQIWNADRLAQFHGPVQLPDGSVSIKAAWQVVRDPSGYISRRDGAATFALIGLNLAAKRHGQWFWATFEHVDNRCLWRNPYRQPDGFGFAATPLTAHKGDVPLAGLRELVAAHHLDPAWFNYRLVGVQQGFGPQQQLPQPALLGNSVLEFDHLNQDSSCATCHLAARYRVQQGAVVISLPLCRHGANCVGLPSGGVLRAPALDSLWAFLCTARTDVSCQALPDNPQH